MKSFTSQYYFTRNINKVLLTSIGVKNSLQFFFYTCRYCGITNTTSTVLKCISPLLLIHSSQKSIGTQIIFMTEHLINLFINNLSYSTSFSNNRGSNHSYSTSFTLP